MIFRSSVLEQAQLPGLLSLRLVCVSWARVVLPMDLFPRARLVVPREVPRCSPEFLAGVCRTFAHAPLELVLGRSGACYPGPLAVGSIADSPDIAAASVVCRLGRSRSARVPLEYLGSALARLLAAGKIAALSLGTSDDQCSVHELAEIVRVFRGPERDRAAVRGLHITQNPVLLSQRAGACRFAELVALLPNLESLTIDHSVGAHYQLVAPAVSRLRCITSLTLDGAGIEPLLARDDFDPTTLFPRTLSTLSLRRVYVRCALLPRLVAGICALEGVVACNLAAAMLGVPDDACIHAITSLLNKPTVRRLDLSRNALFTNDYARDEQLARAMVTSQTLECLSITAVCTPAHVVHGLVLALPLTRLSRLELSLGVYGTVIPPGAIALLRERAPPSCSIVVESTYYYRNL